MPPLRHFTRHMPKRRDEILDGGSIYWVVNGVIMVRQLVLDILADTEADGSACAALVLEQELIRVEGRAMRAFQGWRYLDPKDAPADLAAMGKGAEEMPDSMRRALAALALL